MISDAQRFGRERRDQSGTIRYRYDCVERTGGYQRIARGVGIVKPYRNRTVTPGAFQHMAPVGGQHEIEPEPARGVGESARLITGGCGYKQNTGHTSMLSTAQH